ncbi:UPAR/Ly6 domain-containing protein crok [Rhynchophorus ferrugineus]|uniref:UPAR/Ly6 domain-containing protein crok n=1 Tax=Rhynchophorus ferrugineus TaxID=354439 RepID=UPI003FCEA34D
MYLKSLFVLFAIFRLGESIRCYQCSSAEDRKGEDNCGSYKKFDKTSNIAIDCNSEESHMPGSFCMKVTQQSPKGFIWDGRWRQVIRRCASVADTGVTGVCNWGVYDNGVYWEECYCSENECNGTGGPLLLKSVCYMSLILVLLCYFG